MTHKERIENELLFLHITPNYHGYRPLVEMLLLALDDEDRLLNANERLFLPAAEKYGYKVQNVTRNVRTIVKNAWRDNPNRLREISGYTLDARPTPVEFITLFYTYIQRTEEKLRS